MSDGQQRVRLPVHQMITVIVASSILVALIGLTREALALATGVRSDEFYLKIFQFDAEMSIPAWYSGALMLIAAVLLLVCSAIARTIRPSEFIWWLLLGVGFIYLSADEVAGIHERVGQIAALYVATSGVLSFTWLIVGIPAVLAAAALFLPFLLRMDRRPRWMLMAAGALFVGGAVGFEMLGGLAASSLGKDSAVYLVVVCLEESLELAGLTLLVSALLLRLRDDCRQVALEFC